MTAEHVRAAERPVPRPSAPASPGRHSSDPADPPQAAQAAAIPVLPVVLAAVGAGLGALAAALYVSGGLTAMDEPELSQAGGFTTGARPVAEFLMNAAGTATVGALLIAAVFLPSPGRRLPSRAHAALRAASWCAVVWAPAALATAVLSFSVLIGEPFWTTLTSPALPGYLTDVSQGRSFVTVALLAAIVAVAAHLPRTPAGAGLLLAVALTGLLPPVFTGHTATTPDHAAAVFLLCVHVTAVAVWVGGLAVLAVIAVRAPDLLSRIVPRYSTLALSCFIAVAVSGVLSAWLRLGGTPWPAIRSGYGLLLVAKTIVLGILGLLGLWHRRSAIPALTGAVTVAVAGARLVFARIAAVEVVVMAAAMGLATGLAGSHAPETDAELGTRAALLLGYDLPGPADLRAYVVGARPDPLFLTVIALAAVAYAVGVVRLRRRGHGWPAGRIAAWYGGLLVLLVVTCGGLARYSMVLFSAHAVQHLLLTLLVPLLLLPGAPVTLALRTMRNGESAGDAHDDVGLTPRDVLLGLLRSRPYRAVAGRPAVAVAVCLASLYGFYFTPLFAASLRSHLLHSVLMVLFVLAGMIGLAPFTRAYTGGEAGRTRRDRTRLLLSLTVGHAAFGLLFVVWSGVLAADWYAALGRVWGPSSLLDQQRAGTAIWAVGAATALPLALARLLVRRR